MVSVPSGCTNLEWIDHCWDWLEKFQSIVLFGEYPRLLRFNMFRYGLNIDELFDMAAYEDALRWVDATIRRIRAEKGWLVSKSGYFCRWICSVRQHCPIGETIMNSGRRP